MITPSGFRELFYGDRFHGIPLVLYQKNEADLMHAAGDGEFEVVENPVDIPAPRTPQPR